MWFCLVIPLDTEGVACGTLPALHIRGVPRCQVTRSGFLLLGRRWMCNFIWQHGSSRAWRLYTD